MGTVARHKPLLCRLGFHEPGSTPVWNNGYLFGSCSRCRCDLLRRPQEKWRPVPRGYKVAWKPRPPGYPRWTVDTPGLSGSDTAPRPRRLRDLLLTDDPPA